MFNPVCRLNRRSISKVVKICVAKGLEQRRDKLYERFPDDEIDGAKRSLKKFHLDYGDKEINGLMMFLAISMELANGLRQTIFKVKLREKLGEGRGGPDSFLDAIAPMIMAGVIYTVATDVRSLDCVYLLTDLGNRLFNRCDAQVRLPKAVTG